MMKSYHWNWAHILKLNTWVFHHQIYVFMKLRNMLKKISPILVKRLHREPDSLTCYCWKVWSQYLKSYHFPFDKKFPSNHYRKMQMKIKTHHTDLQKTMKNTKCCIWVFAKNKVILKFLTQIHILTNKENLYRMWISCFSK